MSARVTAAKARPKASCRASTVRAANERSSRFTFDQIISMGLKSGEYGGRYSKVAPAASTACLTCGRLCAREVVHHHHVAATQRRRQHLLDVDVEDLAVHGAVDGERRRQPVQADRRHRGHHLPVSLRSKADLTRAAEAAAVGAHEVGQRAALVEEDHAGEVAAAQLRQRVEPAVTLRLDVGPLLLAGVQRLFFRVTPSSRSQRPTVCG